jgi:hypothetical protein
MYGIKVSGHPDAAAHIIPKAEVSETFISNKPLCCMKEPDESVNTGMFQLWHVRIFSCTTELRYK